MNRLDFTQFMGILRQQQASEGVKSPMNKFFFSQFRGIVY